MTLMIDAAAITPPQRKFLDSLVKERDWSLADVATVRVAKIVSRPDKDGNLVTFVSKKDASTAIDTLLKKCPKIAVAPTAAPANTQLSWASVKANAIELLNTVPASYKGIKYAVPNTDTKSVSPFVFYEVKEYKGKRYLNRLQGAPGDWNRQFVSYKDYAGIVERIKTASYITKEDEPLSGPMAAAARFSDMYTICACCGAKLSNGKSIAAKFGPVCITKF
jgi:hypothetical protein